MEVNSRKIQYFKDQKSLTNEEFLELKKNKLKYSDDIFPPNNNSLFGCNKEGVFYNQKDGIKIAKKFIENLNSKNLIWERISEMPEYNEILNKEYSYESIIQGSIGDCYLISALCALSQYPKLLINEKDNCINIIHNFKYREVGYYEIKLFINGEYQIVIVDDYIPYDPIINDIAFVKTSKNFFWILLVEKAIAKVFGGYSNIVNYSEEEYNDEQDNKTDESNNKENNLLSKTNIIFQMLISFSPKYFYFDNDYNKKHHKEKIVTKEEIYNKIYYEGLYQNGNKTQFLITTGSLNEKQGILEENYIPYNHSFSILDMKTIILKESKTPVKLLLLNNPWGKNIYNSEIFGKYKYNPNDPNLKELNNYIRYNINSKDGTFWIDFDTFYQSFSYVSLCKIIPNANFKIYKFNDSDYYKRPMIFNLIVENDMTEIVISIHFTNNLYQPEIPIRFGYLLINKYDENNKIIESYSVHSSYEDLNKNLFLNKGKYVIYVYIPEKYNYNKNVKLRASLKIVYNKNIIFDFIKFDDDFMYLLKNISDIFHLKNCEIEKKDKDIYNNFCFNIIEGFCIIHLKNYTNKSYSIDYTLTLTDYEILSPGFNKKEEGKFFKNDFMNPFETKFYICIINNKKTKIMCNYTYREEKNISNNVIFFDNSFINFNNLKNEENLKKMKNINTYEFFSPEYYKIDRKIYEIMKYYDSDNLIHDLGSMNKSNNTIREMRAIYDDNGIHSFGSFSKKYQSKTYSKDNLHGFQNKENKKLTINNEKNKYYLVNENNSGFNFITLNNKDKDKNSVFNDKSNVSLEENKNEGDENNKIHNELNDRKYLYSFIDYMYKVEKKNNSNVSFTEVLNKYRGIWNKLKDEEKIVYVYINMLEEQKCIDINEII